MCNHVKLKGARHTERGFAIEVFRSRVYKSIHIAAPNWPNCRVA